MLPSGNQWHVGIYQWLPPSVRDLQGGNPFQSTTSMLNHRMALGGGISLKTGRAKEVKEEVYEVQVPVIKVAGCNAIKRMGLC